MVVRHIGIKTFQQPGNSQGMLYPEWATIRAVLRLPNEEQKGPSDSH